jgi:hypothetical protein
VNGYSGAFPPGYSLEYLHRPINVIKWIKETPLDKFVYIARKETEGQVSKELSQVSFSLSGTTLNYHAFSLNRNKIVYDVGMNILNSAPHTKSIIGNSMIQCTVLLKNKSTFIWRSSGDKPVNISYKIFEDKTGKLVVPEGIRSALPDIVFPNSYSVCEVKIIAPSVKGRYRVMLALVQEFERWFEPLDPAQACYFEVEVI